MRRYRSAVMFCAALVAAFALLGAAAAGEKSAEAESAAEYSLRSEGSVVSVYMDGEMVASTEIDLTGLRSADRELLQKGVAVRDYEELIRLIEDLNS